MGILGGFIGRIGRAENQVGGQEHAGNRAADLTHPRNAAAESGSELERGLMIQPAFFFKCAQHRL